MTFRGRLKVPLAHTGGYLFVSVPEGRALPHERLRRVGREEQRIGCSLRKSLAVDLEPADENGERTERQPNVATRREHRRLVLLQVAVVRQREPLHGREEPGEPADRGSGLPTNELCHVRVELLRHHRRPGRGGLGQFREPELRSRPEHDLLADARQVREEHRCRVEVVEREVAVGDCVDRVPHLPRRSWQLERRAGERPCSERALRRRIGCRREACPVAVEHLHPGEQMMTERDRLRPLKMRVAGHERGRLGLGERENDEREGVDRVSRLRARIEDVQPERRRDLVVARAARMDLSSDVAEKALDSRMHVLVRLEVALRALGNLGEATLDLVQLVGAQQARVCKPSCMLGRRLAVVGQKLRVVRAEKLPHLRVELLPDPPFPGRHTVILARFRAACSSVSSDEIRMNPSAASCGNVSPVPYEASSAA